MAVNWSYYDAERFERVDEKYLPLRGEGETMATQIVTAVNKLVYKWYNDGDVFDNTGYLDGWWNDLSSYANWLYKYASPDTGCDKILDCIWDCYNGSDYEDLLQELADTLLDMEWLEIMEVEKVGSIYECDGPFRFEEYNDDDDEEDEEW